MRRRASFWPGSRPCAGTFGIRNTNYLSEHHGCRSYVRPRRSFRRARNRRAGLATIHAGPPLASRLCCSRRCSQSPSEFRRSRGSSFTFFDHFRPSRNGEQSERSLSLEIAELQTTWPSEEGRRWLAKVHAAVEASTAAVLLERGNKLAERAKAWANVMDFKMLYNEQRHLFSVGYNLSHGRLDPAHYDLLASEASLTSYLAIARGDVPPRHWFQLGRPVVPVGHGLVLLSWGGTMFEYLMPRLFLRPLPGTLLAESQQGAVEKQREYGRQCGTPWGMSESAFSTVDGDLNYQYQAFGTPGLGLKRGLNKDLVVAPYATFLAVGIAPHAALANLKRLADEGAAGRYGYYEAIDYTRDRLQPRQHCAIVKCYMAHHQGMSFLALANFLLDEPVTRRLRRRAAWCKPRSCCCRSACQLIVTSPALPRENGPPPATVDSPVMTCRRSDARPIQTFHARTSCPTVSIPSW